MAALDQPGLHELIDRLQLHIIGVHDGIAQTYFPSRAAPPRCARCNGRTPESGRCRCLRIRPRSQPLAELLLQQEQAQRPCSIALTADRYHKCRSSKCPCHPNQMAGMRYVITREPELMSEGQLLPRAWNRLEQVNAAALAMKFQERIRR